MKSFRQYINEDYGKSLTVFDVDETLFKTSAMIKVIKDGKVIQKLNNQQYNDYKLGPGEEFDYGEFKDAKLFDDTSIPIWSMIRMAKRVIRAAVTAASKVIIMTARSDFDDKNMFIRTFKRFGINIRDVYVERAGNLGSGPPAENKRVLLKKYLDTGKYNRIRFFDDSVSNIRMFKLLKNEYPNVEFNAYLVSHTGKVKKV